MSNNVITNELNVMIKQVFSAVAAVFSKPTVFGGILAPVIGLIAPVAPIIHVMIGLVFVDNLTAIKKYFHDNDYKWRDFFKHVTSKKMGTSITKLIAYLVLILASYLIDVYIIKDVDVIALTKIASVYFSLRELKSIAENTAHMTNGNLWTVIKNVFKYGFKEGIAKSFENEEDNQ